MTLTEIAEAFSFYGFDITFLAALTCAAVQILKRVAFKNPKKKKILTFLPFAFGTLFYAVYQILINLDISVLFHSGVGILEHGLTVGGVSTLLYVLYEQFVREEDGLSAVEGVIKTLVEGYVPSENAESVAKEIAAAIERDVTGTGAKKAAEILERNCVDADKNSITLLAKLIIETLAHITTKT